MGSTRLENLIRTLIVVFFAIVIVAGISYASSSLIPTSNTITAQSYTLSDIYNKMMNISYSPVTHTVSTTTAPAPSFRTLTEIYEKLNTESSLITPGNIREGVTIFGVTGNYTGSGGGGIGTGRLGVNGLYWSDAANYIWTGPRIPSNISRSNGLCLRNSSGTYTINPFVCTPNSGLYDHNGIIIGAIEYCQYMNTDGSTLGNTPQNIWRLPTIAELRTELMAAGLLGYYDTRFPRNNGLGYYWWSSEIVPLYTTATSITHKALIYSPSTNNVTTDDLGQNYTFVGTICVRQ